MDLKILIKAQQRLYEMDMDSNSKALAMLLTVKANQYVNEEFYLTDSDIMKYLGIKDKHRIINARKTLVEKGIITYTKGQRGTKSTYKVNWNGIIYLN